MSSAACRGLTALMFPDRGDTAANARKVCNDCPVWRECLDWAMTAACPHEGIVAGLTPKERRQLRRYGRPLPDAVKVIATGDDVSPVSTAMPWRRGEREPPFTTWTRTELLQARR